MESSRRKTNPKRMAAAVVSECRPGSRLLKAQEELKSAEDDKTAVPKESARQIRPSNKTLSHLSLSGRGIADALPAATRSSLQKSHSRRRGAFAPLVSLSPGPLYFSGV